MKVLVNEYGKASQVKVERTDHEILNEAAITAIKNTKFTPAKHKDKAVGAWITLPVVFRLDNEKKDK